MRNLVFIIGVPFGKTGHINLVPLREIGVFETHALANYAAAGL